MSYFLFLRWCFLLYILQNLLTISNLYRIYPWLQGYRKAALKYHPDKNAAKSDEEKVESEKMFREVGEAYEILTDPEKKKNYDEGVDVEVSTVLVSWYFVEYYPWKALNFYFILLWYTDCISCIFKFFIAHNYTVHHA